MIVQSLSTLNTLFRDVLLTDHVRNLRICILIISTHVMRPYGCPLYPQTLPFPHVILKNSQVRVDLGPGPRPPVTTQLSLTLDFSVEGQTIGTDKISGALGLADGSERTICCRRIMEQVQVTVLCIWPTTPTVVT